MQVHTFTKKLTDPEKEMFLEHLEKKLPKFEQFLREFDADEVKLNVKVEKFPSNDAFKVEMEMTIPKASHKSLHSGEDSRDLLKAIDFAKAKLIEQLKKAVEKLHHEHMHAA
jgi:ribosomal subunit interface protein